MSEQQFRVGGSGYTVLKYNGQHVEHVEMIRDQAPQPVVPFEPIQPIDARHPIEIAYPRAHGVGTLTIEFLEKWKSNFWGALSAELGDFNDIIDVFDYNLTIPGGVVVSKIVQQFNPDTGTATALKVIDYQNCHITNIDESEEIRIGTMTLPKGVTITYTHKLSYFTGAASQ